MNLYQLTEDYQALVSMDIEDEAVATTLDAVDQQIEDKAHNICLVIKNMDGDIDAIDAEIKRLSDKKKAAANRKEKLREYLKQAMIKVDKQKIKSPLFSLNILKGREIVSVTNQDALDKKYIKVVESVNKTLLKNDLKSGEIDGAEIITGEPSLQIK